MKNTFALLILSMGCMGLAGQTLAAGDAAAGKDKAAQVCASCHGADGNSTDAQYPRLAGQHASYLVQALKEYTDGGRNNPIMLGFASGLSEADIENLAAWFASQPGGVTTPVVAKRAAPE
jgi:cytochrome c553